MAIKKKKTSKNASEPKDDLDLADEELEKVKPQKDGDDEFLALLEADLEDDEIVLGTEEKAQKLSQLKSLKQKNPRIKTLV